MSGVVPIHTCFFGEELKVGDDVVYAVGPKSLRIGTIQKITPKGIKVDDHFRYPTSVIKVPNEVRMMRLLTGTNS